MLETFAEATERLFVMASVAIVDEQGVEDCDPPTHLVFLVCIEPVALDRIRIIVPSVVILLP